MAEFTNRFSGKANDYNKCRPKYPKTLLDLMIAETGFSADKTVADIGSGTGISSEMFVNFGNQVFAVEPNENMRQSAMMR